MNVALAIILIVFYVNSINAGLTPEEQNKLMDAINKDRQELGKKMNVQMPNLKYDKNLESRLEDCNKELFDRVLFPLKMNSVGEEYFEKVWKGNKEYPIVYLFYPGSYTIGCCKTYRCTMPIKKGPNEKYDEFVGKTLEIYGACAISDTPRNVSISIDKMFDAGLPSISKYGDLLGVTNSQSYSKFSAKALNFIFTLSLVFFV